MTGVTPYTDITDPRVAKALAHPLRIKILNALEQRTASPSDIADEVGAPLTNVSYHIRHLHQLGVIKLVRRSVRGGTVKHYYRAESRPRITDEAWAEVPEIVKQALSDAILGQIAEQVNASAATGGFNRTEANASRVPLVLDGRGWDEAAAELKRTRERLAEIQRDAQQRLDAGGDGAHEHATAVLMLFETAPADPRPSGTETRRPRQARNATARV